MRPLGIDAGFTAQRAWSSGSASLNVGVLSASAPKSRPAIRTGANDNNYQRLRARDAEAYAVTKIWLSIVLGIALPLMLAGARYAGTAAGNGDSAERRTAPAVFSHIEPTAAEQALMVRKHRP